MNDKIDYPKIIITGVVLFMLIWGILFMLGIAYLKQLETVKYGSFLLSIILTSMYILLSIKYCNRVKVDLSKIDTNINSLKRSMSNFEIFYVVLLVIYLVASYYVYYNYSLITGKVMFGIAVLIVIIENILRYKKSKG